MKPLQGRADIEQALQAVGELVTAEGHSYAIVILGGAALSLLGIIDRATRDVDIVAFASDSSPGGSPKLVMPPQPMPEPLARAIRTVAGDFGLDEKWLNTGPDLQMRMGLPDGMAARLEWRDFAGLRVGLTSPRDLVAFKLFAAAAWVKSQDANTDEFQKIVDTVVEYVRKNR